MCKIINYIRWASVSLLGSAPWSLLLFHIPQLLVFCLELFLCKAEPAAGMQVLQYRLLHLVGPEAYVCALVLFRLLSKYLSLVPTQ